MPDIYVARNKKAKPAKSKPKPKKAKARTLADKLEVQRTTNPLSALVIRPQKVFFETQESKEEIILIARRHLITNLRWILTTVVMFLLPRILPRIFPEIFTLIGYRPLFFLIWYMATCSFAFQHFLKWFFNVNIITDERVVDIDFPSLLYRDISSAKIDMIQDISVKTGGFVRSLFNYGDVHIQTAAEQREFIFEAIPQPEKVIGILNELVTEEEQEKIEGRVR